jgi:ATP-dependent Clp protease ATP-binding subunit ClpC
MFDRFTESARRVIFWARHEASHRGDGSITPEHLLLGVFREAPIALKRFGLSDSAIASLPEEVHNLLPECAIPTSVDMPLSPLATSVLSQVVNAAPSLTAIHPFDILSAIASQEGTPAAALLRDRRNPSDSAT